MLHYSMASVGLDTMGSQFYITLRENPQLDGRCTAFGRIVSGAEVLPNLEKVSLSLHLTGCAFCLMVYANLFTGVHLPQRTLDGDHDC